METMEHVNNEEKIRQRQLDEMKRIGKKLIIEAVEEYFTENELSVILKTLSNSSSARMLEQVKYMKGEGGGECLESGDIVCEAYAITELMKFLGELYENKVRITAGIK